VVPVFLAGCGSSGSTKASVPATTTTTTTTAGLGATAPNTPEQRAADQALARRAVLKLTDLPVGYESKPASDSESDVPKAALVQFASCMHMSKADAAEFLNGADEDDQPSAEADFEYDSPTGQTSFESQVELDRTSADISRPFETLDNGDPACWKDLFDAAFREDVPKGTTIGPTTVTELETSGLGDQAEAFRAEVVVTSRGRSVPVTLDFYFVGHGRAGISLFGSGIGRAVEPSFERLLVQTVVDRLDEV
jgi:hypothetical protein